MAVGLQVARKLRPLRSRHRPLSHSHTYWWPQGPCRPGFQICLLVTWAHYSAKPEQNLITWSPRLISRLLQVSIQVYCPKLRSYKQSFCHEGTKAHSGAISWSYEPLPLEIIQSLLSTLSFADATLFPFIYVDWNEVTHTVSRILHTRTLDSNLPSPQEAPSLVSNSRGANIS